MQAGSARRLVLKLLHVLLGERPWIQPRLFQKDAPIQRQR